MADTDLWAGNQPNYQKMFDAGVRVAYINTWPGTYSDPARDTHREGCALVGVETGPYYVGNYTLSVKPTVGVPLYQKMLELAAKFNLIPTLDFEFVAAWGKPDDTAASRKSWRGRLIDWLGRFYEGFDQQYQGDSLIYINLDMVNLLRPAPDFLTKRLLFLASTLTNPAASLYAPWPAITIQQYALDVPAAWSVGKVDLDRINVPIERLRRGAIIDHTPCFQTFAVTICNPYYPTLAQRKGPGWAFDYIGSPIKNGTKVTILAVQGDWGQIAETAWIYMPFTKR